MGHTIHFWDGLIVLVLMMMTDELRGVGVAGFFLLSGLYYSRDWSGSALGRVSTQNIHTNIRRCC